MFDRDVLVHSYFVAQFAVMGILDDMRLGADVDVDLGAEVNIDAVLTSFVSMFTQLQELDVSIPNISDYLN